MFVLYSVLIDGFANLKPGTLDIFFQHMGGAIARLLALKNRYDAKNLFRLNANIRPTA